MPSSSPNLSNPNHSFDKTKGYKNVVFQQGKPILDVDLNDASSALSAQTTSTLIEKMGYGPPQLDFKDWAVMSVESTSVVSNRNQDNFALSLGRLDTFKGVIDTASLKDVDSLDKSIIFDYGKIQDLTVTSANDRVFSNYMYKGTITDPTSTLVFLDENKNFGTNDKKRLLGINRSIVVSPDSASVASQADDAITDTTKDFIANITEGGCRVRFTSGALSGEEQVLTGVSGSTLTVGVAFSAIPAIGDEYVIIPSNTLKEYRDLYDATQTQDASKVAGLTTGLPQLLMYVQVFDEDISSEEDTSIQSSALGFETTHRTQLRWCVRVCKYRGSVDGEGNNTSLKPYHIMSYLNQERKLDNQTMFDSVDMTSKINTQSQFWKSYYSNNASPYSDMDQQNSPFSNMSISPMHFFTAQEAQIDRMSWAFLKAVMLEALDANDGTNDVQLLNIHYSESKSEANAPNETLSPYFYLGHITDNQVAPIVHARVNFGWPFEDAGRSDATQQEGSFLAPPRVFHTQADLSADNLQSRTLFGVKGGLLYGDTAPLVFGSVASHLSFLDQVLLGMSGLGSALGKTGADARIPSAVNYQLAGTTTGFAQAGYGAGSVVPLNPLATTTEETGFVSGTSSYLIREKGARASHTVGVNDEDLGWSFYKKEASGLNNNNTTDVSVRAWDEGPAQAVAFLNGINFRKLAIKTTAHNSADLFTISETRVTSATEAVTMFLHGSSLLQASSNSFRIPYLQNSAQADRSNVFLDSYSYLTVEDTAISAGEDYRKFIPKDVSLFDPKELMKQYQHDGGVMSLYTEDQDVDKEYGPWNRFNVNNTTSSANLLSDMALDTWTNRCTSMKLRYHIGDFYPAEVDSRGYPRNLLVDNLNLFVRIEPLSLTHWMTMPKHQHSILENSFVMAEGIEALLKVAHGLGDTQKLINGNNQPLVQSTSPSHTETRTDSGVDTTVLAIGAVDDLDLPFGHEHQPFVHWYHPAQNHIQAPAPSSPNTAILYPTQDGNNNNFRVTLYPKWGRRSLIIPALVPSTGSAYTYNDGVNDHTLAEYTGSPASHTDTSSTWDGIGGQVDVQTDSTTINTTLFPYPIHSTHRHMTGGANSNNRQYTMDNGTLINDPLMDLSFPSIPTLNDLNKEVGPVFLPASRMFAQQAQDTDATPEPHVGFHTFIENYSHAYWNDVAQIEDDSFPYDDKSVYWEGEAYGLASNLPTGLQAGFDAWSVPVMRSAIRTRTVAGIVDLVRTSFATGLDDANLSADYDYSMPFALAGDYTSGGQIQGIGYNTPPAIGPDNPTDTLFVGDMGTALGGNGNRSGFLSPFNLGIGAIHKTGVLVHNSHDTDGDVFRDPFQYARYQMDLAQFESPIMGVFTAINDMGLQHKLLWNCSLRVLHSRPTNYSEVSPMPKSLTEIFLVHDRTGTSIVDKAFTSGPTDPNKKPFLHLGSMHPASASVGHPNYDKVSHLYGMISDSTGGTNEKTAHLTSSRNKAYNYSVATVKTSSMGDTYAVDPFDYTFNHAQDSVVTEALFKDTEHPRNSGMEIDLINELNRAHTNSATNGLALSSDINGTSLNLLDMIPTANELTMAGDHELVFVLYTGHYGAKLHDTNDVVNIEHVPSVAGCHISATLEVNRPSERHSSDAVNERHYGVEIDSAPIKTHSILSTKN